VNQAQLRSRRSTAAAAFWAVNGGYRRARGGGSWLSRLGGRPGDIKRFGSDAGKGVEHRSGRFLRRWLTKLVSLTIRWYQHGVARSFKVTHVICKKWNIVVLCQLRRLIETTALRTTPITR
jgi:hypothetical protein